MKRAYTLLAALIITISMLAQTPQKMSYQAVVRNNSDQLVTDTQVGMQISILHGSASGTPVYVETQTPTTNTNGLVSIEIGGDNATVVLGEIDTIDWGNGPYFIKTETDLTGGTNYTITGTSQLLSVPYALHAKTAENITGAITETQNLADVLGQSNDGNAKQIKNIANPTDAQDAATKAYIDAIKEFIYNELLDAGLNGVVKDIEDNTYKTIKIGTQVWMAENLSTTKYTNGNDIPLVTDGTDWSNLTTPGYCWYNNNEASYKNINGALYNWYAVNSNNLCPSGWHVPTQAELIALIDYLTNNGYGYEYSGDDIAKSLASTSSWQTYGTEGAIGNDPINNNASGFSAVATGGRSSDGIFTSNGYTAGFWSSTENGINGAFGFVMSYALSTFLESGAYKECGSTVRCLKN